MTETRRSTSFQLGGVVGVGRPVAVAVAGVGVRAFATAAGGRFSWAVAAPSATAATTIPAHFESARMFVILPTKEPAAGGKFRPEGQP